jgi:alcohol dehydrogenase
MLLEITSFDYHLRTRILFGLNSVDRLGELARELGARRVLLVTDPGIVAAGHAERARHALESAGLEVVVFDEVRENPTTRDVDRCLALARSSAIEAFIGLGGGSSMDTAKGCNFLLTNGGRMQDYWGIGKAVKPMLPLIAVPTTAGTGSECQSFALIADEHTHQKMACGDPKAAPLIAVLDPILTLTQPRHVTAYTGLDAIAHSVETAVTRRRNALSMLFSQEAFRLTITNFPRVLNNPSDLQARAGMQLGAAYAGIAIENSMLGAAHSAANPLTAHFGLIHGLAVGLMLPHIVHWNAHELLSCQTYCQLAEIAGLVPPGTPTEKAVTRLVEQLQAALATAQISPSLAEHGVSEEAIPLLAQEAAMQWTAQFNPRQVNVVDFETLYRVAL